MENIKKYNEFLNKNTRLNEFYEEEENEWYLTINIKLDEFNPDEDTGDEEILNNLKSIIQQKYKKRWGLDFFIEWDHTGNGDYDFSVFKLITQIDKSDRKVIRKKLIPLLNIDVKNYLEEMGINYEIIEILCEDY